MKRKVRGLGFQGFLFQAMQRNATLVTLHEMMSLMTYEDENGWSQEDSILKTSGTEDEALCKECGSCEYYNQGVDRDVTVRALEWIFAMARQYKEID